MGDSVEKVIKDTISSADIVIFSKSRCPYCVRAKELFKKKGKKFVAVELDELANCAEMQDYLKTITGARSVPRIFIKGKCYGGCDDLMELEETGKLDELLSEC